MQAGVLPAEPISSNRVYRYSPFLDVWVCRACEYAPWLARDTDDPACRDLARGFGRTQAERRGVSAD